MSTFFLTTYMLIWPVLVAAILYVLVSAFLREWREARMEGRSLV